MIRERQHRRFKYPDTIQTPSYVSHGSMIYATSNAGNPPPNTQPEKSCEESKATIPSIRIDTAGTSVLRHPAEGNIPIINITSPQVVIETASPSHSLVCVADPQVASGLIIQPEHGLQDDPTVIVRGKFKEHLLNQDASSDTSSVHKAKEHRLDDDAEQEQPKSSSEHAIVECTDGASSPRLTSIQMESASLSVLEISQYTVREHPSISQENDENQLSNAEDSHPGADRV
ncbi:hypothetical protein PWT90_10902 [Aphanocladium album]|nr:hypothetical protein PWT90_10902 [Aphanocladium album]